MVSRPGRLTHALRWFVVRTGAGPLRGLWLFGYQSVIATAAAVLRRWAPGAAVYVRGGLGAARQPVPGLSDIDLILVMPDSDTTGAARRRVLERWNRLAAGIPWLGLVVRVNAFEDRELADVTRSNVLTHGLEPGSPPRALFAGRDPLRFHWTVRSRPGLPAPMSDWRRVAGPERRPECPPRSEDDWTAAWLDLQCWWRYAFWTAARPRDPHAAYLAVKLVAEPLRVLLWVRHREAVLSRRDALERGLHHFPDESDGIRDALDTLDRIHRGPDPRLPDRIAMLLRLTQLLAADIGRAADERGCMDVSLVSTDPVPCSSTAGALRDELAHGLGATAIDAVPAADWRARTVPGEPASTILAVHGPDPSSPSVLAAAGALERPGVVIALPTPAVLVMPTLHREPPPMLRGMHRAVQCAQSDPVSFALLSGRCEAAFPELPGWCARDAARRAAAEHRAWLMEDPDEDIDGLLAAARAAMFMESVERGTPRLTVDEDAVCAELDRHGPAAAGLGAAVQEARRARQRHGRGPEPALSRALSARVRGMYVRPPDAGESAQRRARLRTD